MGQLRPVSKTEKIIFPIIVTLLVSFLVPDAAPLVGMLMLGNLMRESGVVDRLVKTAQNELMNIITIFLGVTVGATTTYDVFLTWDTIKIVVLGLVAFCLVGRFGFNAVCFASPAAWVIADVLLIAVYFAVMHRLDHQYPPRSGDE